MAAYGAIEPQLPITLVPLIHADVGLGGLVGQKYLTPAAHCEQAVVEVLSAIVQ